MSADPVQSWLQRALNALHEEQRWHFDTLASVIGATRIRFAVGQERFDLHGEGSSLRLSEPDGAAPVRIVTTQAALRAILSGDLPVLRALREHHLDLRGDIASLTRAARAWRVAVAGAVRSQRCAQLWTDFTQTCPEERT